MFRNRYFAIKWAISEYFCKLVARRITNFMRNVSHDYQCEDLSVDRESFTFYKLQVCVISVQQYGIEQYRISFGDKTLFYYDWC
jgi:hypothetical protein